MVITRQKAEHAMKLLYTQLALLTAALEFHSDGLAATAVDTINCLRAVMPLIPTSIWTWRVYWLLRRFRDYPADSTDLEQLVFAYDYTRRIERIWETTDVQVPSGLAAHLRTQLEASLFLPHDGDDDE